MEYKLKEGIKAPEFALVGSDGEAHKLSDYLGKTVILYFYPKDNTPGCTKEAQDFSERFQEFKDKNAVILGVSADSLKSHEKFVNKIEIPFVLLADENGEVIKLYDVLQEKSMYGKTYMGIERTTFIINEEGIILRIFNKVKVPNHVCTILENI